MKVIIKETGKEEELSLIDPKDGIDYAADFIDIHQNGEFVYDDEQDAYLTSQDDYEWWAKVIADNQALENRVYALGLEYGYAVDYALADAQLGVDLDNHAAAYNQFLDELEASLKLLQMVAESEDE